MSSRLDEVIDHLSRTPTTLRTLLAGLPEKLLHADEGPGTWSSYGIVGHLIHGERTDWIPRAQQILDGSTEPFEPFDREAQNRRDVVPVASLLDEFEEVRRENLTTLRSWELTAAQLSRVGIHPAFGEVTLGQLLSTWGVHDLGHIAQICRVLAHPSRDAVGPWVEYLPILQRRNG